MQRLKRFDKKNPNLTKKPQFLPKTPNIQTLPKKTQNLAKKTQRLPEKPPKWTHNVTTKAQFLPTNPSNLTIKPYKLIKNPKNLAGGGGMGWVFLVNFGKNWGGFGKKNGVCLVTHHRWSIYDAWGGPAGVVPKHSLLYGFEQ